MPQNWIIPSNSSTFDTRSAFENLRELHWSEVGDSSIAMGDTVYLYSSKPDSAITHKCLVTATRVPSADLIDDSPYWVDPEAFAERLTTRTWMRLRLLSSFDKDARSNLTLHSLHEHGLKGTMSGRQRLQPEVLSYIQSIEETAPEPIQQFWWVNQGVTGITSSRSGSFLNLWAALKDAQGHTQPSWDSMEQAQRGDVVVHYDNGYVLGSSRVATRSRPATRPPEFELDERSDDDGRELLLDRFAEFDIPIALDEIPLDLRMSPASSGGPFTSEGKVRRGYFFQIESLVARAVFDTAGLMADSMGPEEVAGRSTAIEPYLSINETDGTTTVKYRKEQGVLRRRLFGTATEARCGICGRSYPVRYLHAAHIKSRSVCSEQERKDWKNIVIPACLFGCDALFEDGMLIVGPGGVIGLNSGHDQTAPFAAFTASLVGRVAVGYTPNNKKYFEWRNTHPRGSRSD